MKKILIVLLALVFAAALLPACGGGGGGSGSSSWMGAGLARSVDKQFGPVTLGANGAKKGEVIPATLANDQDGGTHQVKNLKGKVNKAVVLDAVRMLDEGWFGPPWLRPPVWTPLPGKKADLVSKISTLASGHSVDNNPCEHDSDMDGTPDVKEARCNIATDPNCTGLCQDPAEVKCSGSGRTFDIKFSDCVRDFISTFSTWSMTSTSTHTTTGVCAWTGQQYSCNTAINTQLVTPFITWTAVQIYFNFNPGPPTTSNWTTTTYTDCGSTDVNVHKGTWSTTTSHWITTSTCGLQIEITDCTTTNNIDSTMTTTWTTTWTTGTWNQFTTSTADIWNGKVALNYGVSNVDEQLYHTRYNKLTRVWDEDGAVGGFATVDNAPFVTISGESMEYRVVNPGGWMTDGTTCRYKNGTDVPNFDCEPDDMEIDHLNVQVDHDGKDGTVFPTGSYATKSGVDAEDGQFEFSGGSAIVQVLGAAWLSGDTTGDVYEISFFDKDNPGDYLCETAHGTPCSVQVDINYAARTYDVLTSDCADVKLDTGIKY